MKRTTMAAAGGILSAMMGCEHSRLSYRRPVIETTVPSEVVSATYELDPVSSARVSDVGEGVFEVIVLPIRTCYQTQERADWCWAACVAMAHCVAGRETPTQSQLVEAARGSSEDGSASFFEIVHALRPDMRSSLDAAGLVNSRMGFSSVTQTSDQLIADLHMGEVWIAGLKGADGYGHAVIVYGARYMYLSEMLEEIPLAVAFWRPHRPNWCLVEVALFDPLRGPEGYFRMSGEEFAQQCDFIVGHSLAGWYLQEQIDMARGRGRSSARPKQSRSFISIEGGARVR